jgi:hypothetical protein
MEVLFGNYKNEYMPQTIKPTAIGGTKGYSKVIKSFFRNQSPYRSTQNTVQIIAETINPAKKTFASPSCPKNNPSDQIKYMSPQPIPNIAGIKNMNVKIKKLEIKKANVPELKK